MGGGPSSPFDDRLPLSLLPGTSAHHVYLDDESVLRFVPVTSKPPFPANAVVRGQVWSAAQDTVLWVWSPRGKETCVRPGAPPADRG